MKANNKKQVFKDLKTLKTLRQKIKTQQAPTTAGSDAVPAHQNKNKPIFQSAPKKTSFIQTTDQDLFLQAVKDVKPLKSKQSTYQKEQKQHQKNLAFQKEQFKRKHNG